MKEKAITFIKKEKLTLIGIIGGAVVGYLYWRFVGCASGTCPITSRVLPSTLYGAALGGLLLSIFKTK